MTLQKTAWIGKSVTRIEDPPLVTGRGRFAGDIAFPHMLHMRVVRSSYAHARVVKIDTAAARVAKRPPRWVDEIPPLRIPWFASELASLRLHLLTSSPPAFRKRNLFVDSTLGGRA